MCKYCKPITDDENARHLRSRKLAGSYSSDGKQGFFLSINSNRGEKIVGEHLSEQDVDDREAISYLKAWHFNHYLWRFGEHLAVQIYYCPFCGKKL